MHSRPRKQFGQHWLRSPEALQSIIQAAALEAGDRVLEIGPGEGVLTRELLKHSEPTGAAVTAVEIDRDLCVGLRQSFRLDLETGQLALVEGDFLALDWDEVTAAHRETPPNKVVANIPYNITGPILERLLGKIASPRQPAFDQIVLLVQKEVAERVCARPGRKQFGALSVRVQYLADCELVCAVPARAFYPPPKVDSAVIRLRPRPFPTTAEDPKFLEKLVKLGFAMKRKMLRNNLKGLVEREALEEILGAIAAKPEVRAEELSLEQWVKLSDALS